MSDIRKRIRNKGTTYQVRYLSKAANSVYAYASFPTLKEARDFVHNLGSLRHAPSETILRVSEGVDRWIDICEKIGRDGRETVEPETLKEYRRRAKVMKEYDWQKCLHELERTDIVHFRNWLLENKTRDLARRTLSSFHSVLIEMKRQGVTGDDPAAGITIRSGRYEDEESEVEIPSDQEMRDILGAADDLAKKNKQYEKCWARYRPMIYLAAFSGMRPSEYRGLPWSHVFEDRVLVRQRADASGIIGPVKSKAGRRTIYLPARVTELLFGWKERCVKTPDDLVFPTSEAKPLSLRNFRRRACVPLMKEAGFLQTEKIDGKRVESTKYRPYSLRHYYASKLIEKGKDLKFIQQAMGHAQIEMTLNIYGHLIKDREEAHLKTVADIAAELLPV